MNAITVFVLSGLLAKSLYLIKFAGEEGAEISIKTFLYKTFFASWLGELNGSLAYALTFIIIMYGAMWILYRKKIFIKI